MKEHPSSRSSRPLTARQARFCEVYTGEAGHNAALAARLAGYAAASSHVTGCQLLRVPAVAARIEELERGLASALDMTRERLVAELLGAAEMARAQANPAALIAAWKAIGVAAGLYKPEAPSRRSGPDERALLADLEQLSDVALMRIAGQTA